MNKHVDNGVLVQMQGEVHLLCEFGLIDDQVDLLLSEGFCQAQQGFHLLFELRDGLTGGNGVDFASHVRCTQVATVGCVRVVDVMLEA